MANAVKISVTVDNDTARGLAGVRASIETLREDARNNVLVKLDTSGMGSVVDATTEIETLRAAASDDVRVNLDTSGVNSVIEAMAEIEALRKASTKTVRISVDTSVKGIAGAMAEVEALRRASNNTIHVDVDTTVNGIVGAMAEVEALRAVSAKDVDVKLNVIGNTEAKTAISDLRKAAAKDVRVNVKFILDGLTAAKAAIADLRRSTAKDFRANVKVDTKSVVAAEAEIYIMRHAASEDINIDVDVDTAGLVAAEAEIYIMRHAASDDVNVDVDVDTSSVDRARFKIESLGRIRIPGLRTRISVEGLALILPMAAQAAAAVGQIAVAAVGAGAALGVLGAASLPGLMEIKNALQLHKQALTGNKDAVAKYNAALAAMNGPTRQTYEETLKLKDGFKAWGDSLAPSTMPIFTTAMQIILDMLPKLTPLVKGAAGVVQGLLDKFKTKLEHGDLDDIIDKFNSWSVGSLKEIVDKIGEFVGHVKNIVVSDTFQKFMSDVNDNGPMMADTLEDIGTFIGKFVTAAGPMAGLSFKILDVLAGFLNSIPMPVLQVLAPLLLGVALAIKAVNLAMVLLDANPIVLLVVAVALAALLIYQHWDAIKKAMKTAWDWIHKNVLTPLTNFFTKTIPGAATTVWHAIRDAWNHVRDAMKTAYDAVKNNVLTPIVNFFTKTIPSAGGKLVGFFKGLPGKITSATKGMWDGIKNTFKSAINGLIDLWNNFKLTMPAVKVLGKTIIPGFTINTPNLPHLATGGISGGGLAMVGENGPELVRLPSGSSVMNNGATERALSGGNGNNRVVLEINAAGNDTSKMLVEILKNAIRVRGGDVQVVLGK